MDLLCYQELGLGLRFIVVSEATTGLELLGLNINSHTEAAVRCEIQKWINPPMAIMSSIVLDLNIHDVSSALSRSQS